MQLIPEYSLKQDITHCTGNTQRMKFYDFQTRYLSKQYKKYTVQLHFCFCNFECIH